MDPEPWTLIYDEYNPNQEGQQEALCTLGNGYFATRGAAEESTANKIHYPGTYIAGGYNRLKSEVKGKIIENEDFVNWPNWLVLSFRHEEGEWLDLDKMQIIEYEKRLNFQEGVLERNFIVEDGHKRRTQVKTRRIVHMSHEHLAAIHWKIKPLNWQGKLIIHSALDGRVINNGVPRYRDLKGQHLIPLTTGKFGDRGIFLKVKTNQSEITMAQAAITDLFSDGHEVAFHRKVDQQEGYIGENLSLEVEEQREYRLEKTVAIFTSRDRAISEPVIEAQKEVERAPRFATLKEWQKETWQTYWRRCDIDIESKDPQDQLLLRLHIFHLLQTVSKKNIDLDAGVPPRGLHGEAYRGHIFWDELFIFPFMNFSVPEITRSLLMYRYRRMDEARQMAKEAGYEGAMFPWQSGSNGREESQVIHLNPQSGNWIPDNTYLQRHVNGAIAYNIWQYYQITEDYEFLSFYGAEMLLEIAKFWASKVTYNENRKRYEIHHVVGPDEYHTKYPGSDEPGLNNNAYTNVMASWTLYAAQKALNVLDDRRREEVLSYTGLSEDDVQHWREIDHNMFVPITNEGIILQFEGWDILEELDWERYHREYGEILRLDRILEKEGDSTNKYQASKQADVLMLFYLFSSEALEKQFNNMSYAFSPEWIPKNIHYYTKRTAHGSTLSKMVHSWVLARENRERSWHNFAKALVSDFNDIQGGTTEEGIHLGAMGGTIDLIQRCYTGIEYREDTLWFNPRLPEHLECINFRLRYRSRWIKVEVNRKQLKLACDGGREVPVQLKVKDAECTLQMGDTKVFELKDGQAENDGSEDSSSGGGSKSDKGKQAESN